MPATTSLQSITGGDRKILIGAALILVSLMVIGSLGSPRNEGYMPPNVTYSPKKDGAKAAFLLIGELGYRVELWDRPLADLPIAGKSLLILDAPILPKSKLAISEEKESLNSFIVRGGRVLALGPQSAPLLPELKWKVDDEDEEILLMKHYQATGATDINWHAPTIRMRADGYPEGSAESKVEHYEGPAVVSYRVGKGEVIVWADSGALTNDGLDHSGNLQLLLNCLGPVDAGTQIIWDEHFHGETQSLAIYFSRTPAPWLLVQFLIVFAATIVTFSRRHGPVAQLRGGGSRLSPLEFVETIGDIYHRKHAAPEALEISWQRFHAALTRRLGLRPQARSAQIAAAVEERWSWSDPGFAKLLESCERAVTLRDVSEKDALRLIGEMHSRAMEWKLLPRKRGH